MDFLINNMGWFFCIAIVAVLAFIGYKADSKEKKQNNTNNKYISNDEPTNEETPIENNKEENFYYNIDAKSK